MLNRIRRNLEDSLGLPKLFEEKPKPLPKVTPMVKAIEEVRPSRKSPSAKRLEQIERRLDKVEESLKGLCEKVERLEQEKYI